MSSYYFGEAEDKPFNNPFATPEQRARTAANRAAIAERRAKYERENNGTVTVSAGRDIADTDFDALLTDFIILKVCRAIIQSLIFFKEEKIPVPKVFKPAQRVEIGKSGGSFESRVDNLVDAHTKNRLRLEEIEAMRRYLVLEMDDDEEVDPSLVAGGGGGGAAGGGGGAIPVLSKTTQVFGREASLLGFQQGDTVNIKQLKKRYLLQSLRIHPDKSSDPNATQKFQAMKDAYDAVAGVLG